MENLRGKMLSRHYSILHNEAQTSNYKSKMKNIFV